MFENWVLRKILGLRGSFRKLKRTAYWVASSPNISRVIEWRRGGLATCNIWGGKRKTHRVLVRICEESDCLKI
jgi:hypothetical protein